MKRDIHETDIIHPEGKYVVRHSYLVIVQHWLVAASGIVLLFTGFGQLPVYKRYMLDQGSAGPLISSSTSRST
jgi:cytochrome b subunit of formate dehydrogenase